MGNRHTLSREDRALKALFLETALSVPCAEGQGAYAPFNVVHALDVLRVHFPDDKARKRAWSWAKYERDRMVRAAEKKPAMRRDHYVRSASGTRQRLVNDIEEGRAEAPWANGKARTEWGRLIDRSRFPMPRVEFEGRVL